MWASGSGCKARTAEGGDDATVPRYVPRYRRVSVIFEHSIDGGTRKVNRAALTVYGDSEFAVARELKRQYPEFDDITVMECDGLV